MRKRKWPELTTTDGARYRERSYWDERYSAGGEAVEEGEQREWFGAYTALKEALPEDLDRSGAILELGCGSSRLSSDLLADGFACVTAADFSPACLAAASAAAAAAARRPPAAPRPLWLALDARRLPLRAALFDAVVEKGMLDALLAGERDPWRVSKAARRQVGLVLDEVSRVLRPGGHFVSVTFAHPHVRSPLYARRRYGWRVRHRTYGEAFHYHVYVMTRGDGEPPRDDDDDDDDDDEDDDDDDAAPPVMLEYDEREDFLNAIDLSTFL
uniref:EEF1A lysine methyltransferase 4 isoform X1 n=1 Tax=Petromyzon marinus TaxID=7757 RepID=A0AAJ7X1G9_PETMA|nr:EEF1A lysine methyltransferase 4 isoform X1 [Petromyzon marinus]